MVAQAVTPTREECLEREKGTTTLLNNILVRGKRVVNPRGGGGQDTTTLLNNVLVRRGRGEESGVKKKCRFALIYYLLLCFAIYNAGQ